MSMVMPGTANPRRRYQTAGRRLGAQATRDSILQAARSLFAERGFAGTTIEAIAAQAEVAPQTVYAAFGSKAAIAKEFRFLLEREADIPHRFQEMLAEPDPARQLEIVAGIGRYICEQHGDVYEFFAASREPELAAVRKEMLDAQRWGMRMLVDRLMEKDVLRPELDPEDAASILWAVSSIEMYRKLVTYSGWTPDHFERWVAASIQELVLAA
ncbi:MAG: TetR/AcrR family transcriptional regulator [Chloroflexi bacterium]|nr:MAG: TetR/AcrR family transcriptional regulator [Chloroflexota bacterium]